jgi:hypothetical protein
MQRATLLVVLLAVTCAGLLAALVIMRPLNQARELRRLRTYLQEQPFHVDAAAAAEDQAPRITPTRLLMATPVRNNEPWLRRSLLPALEAYAACAHIETLVLRFAVSNSTDGSEALLQAWVRNMQALHPRHDMRVMSLGAVQGTRVHRIAAARNACLEDFERRGDYDAAPERTFYVAFDSDDVNTIMPGPQELLQHLWSPAIARNTQWAALTAFPATPATEYYDMWALRTTRLGDVRRTWIWTRKRAVRRLRQAIAAAGKPYEVLSAFEGFGVYRVRYLAGLRYSNTPEYSDYAFAKEDCEHVAFHAAIRSRGGRIYIDPGIRNGSQ